MNRRGNGHERKSHSRESGHQQWFSSGAVNQKHSYYGSYKIDRSDDDICPQGSAGGLMRYMLQENDRTVIDDGVDAGELAEEGDHNGNDQRLPKRWIQQVSTLFRNGGADVCDFLGGGLRAHDLRKKVLRFLLAAFLHQPARALGNEKERQQETHGG